ncbi:CRISPR-associated helicase Cas3' [Streptomyces sp. AV19]|uniref:CRISPR-associated helicase Cas3' n=1 Tax=Streptomyces sp. AV19 TaxID=2793068 RepID=UPI0018FE4399|nr:CRISPR-associated helicase Cas3' [Streptomyces sp. AV19]MBH1938279.1 CRISPR-associated helicase Cas3' [Streptomyces sp. AV19]MDG4534909.1 CRISPR-associated helicase Cas3' [Streptomyces sp. AV19]
MLVTADTEFDVIKALGALWGKSEEKANGRKNLLLSHLLDTAAIAEIMWDRFLAPSTQRALDAIAGGGDGRGRRFFAWLCGVHDLGKATPAFQRLWAKGAEDVRAAGLTWHETSGKQPSWRHDRAGAHLLCALLPAAGWPEEHIAWVWPLVAGHHGSFPDKGSLSPRPRLKGQLAGDQRWAAVQLALLERFTAQLGFGGLADVTPKHVPSRAAQLHLSGLIVMADWIASDEKHFSGVDELALVTMESARERAGRAWDGLGLRGGWGHLPEIAPEAFLARFGHAPRPSQELVTEVARRMETPGLLVVEAPMGEGKTKAALMAAEILARRFGADGVFVGMPTQATCDPMFGQVRQWAGAIHNELTPLVSLLHGKRMFNKEWRALLQGRTADEFGGVDEYGDCYDDDPYGMEAPEAKAPSHGPAEWFLGAKRGLLCPFVVGTIDQLLFAATRTKHVMLRMAGLAGKVVILDEVHAADVYMSQFLKEGLRWLGQARVPVVLLSATLPPAQRRELVDAYLAGAATREEFTADELPDVQGYPSVTAAWPGPDGTGPQYLVRDCPSWRQPALDVAVELLPEPVPGRTDRRKAQASADASVADHLELALDQGGCALVIRNTVDRAQTLYASLRNRFGADSVRLLHGRLAVGPRADRTEECLRLLGAPSEEHRRPDRLIVVATQLAEQSFDIDADILVTDLAPIDLLLQRIGRLHRHEGTSRPGRLVAPRVLITGVSDERNAVPRFLGASEAIYGRHLLLRAAALVYDAASQGKSWSVPDDVPALVATGYDSGDGAIPPAWRADAEQARIQWETGQRERADKAIPYLLTRRGDREGTTLAGLHRLAVPGATADNSLNSLVRDGDSGVEVVLVSHEGDAFRTLSGRVLTANGDVSSDDLLDDVLAGTVRLPSRFTDQAVKELRPLPGWLGHPRLRYTRALVLGAQHRAVLGGSRLRYDEELGLLEEDMDESS